MATNDKTPLESRLDLFKLDLGKSNDLDKKKASEQTTELTTLFSTLYTEKKGDWTAIKADLTEAKGFTPDMVKNLTFTHALSEWSKDNVQLVKAFQEDKTTLSMRDIALNFDKVQFTDKLIKAQAFPVDADIVVEHYAATLHDQLFHLEPTAVLQNVVQNVQQTPIADPILRGGITTFLNNQYEAHVKHNVEAFNIKTTSIYEAFKQADAFTNIAPELHEGLKAEMKTLQRVVAISPIADAIPVLMKAKMHTAFQVSEMPESQFIAAFKEQFGENGAAIAQQVHTNATNARIRNEHALMALKEAGQGTGIAFIDKSLSVVEPIPPGMSGREPKIVEYNHIEKAKGVFEKHNLSWDLLFGDADVCECGECTSVYSAASYFVELLQYLRNNNLDPDATGTVAIKKTDPKDISNTPLQKLLDRRPDLGCLELTCKNTNTILPYVDLVNEVMENYVVSKHPKPFNVADETSGELLAAPQHTEYQAYCILKDAVYPFTLPYHQPIDQARIDLDFLSTSRTELMDTFRSPRKMTTNRDPIENCDIEEPDPELANIPANANKVLDKLHEAYLNRAVDAECLGLTQEEYVILTKEYFISQEYWDKQCDKIHTLEEYRTKIGVKPVHKYYGYDTEGDMRDATSEKGLTYVKKQFLPRTGIQYTDLVELLLTQCLNPNMPRGKAKFITDNIHFSYRFLQNYKAANGEDKLIEILTNTEKFIQVFPYVKDLPTFLNPDAKKVAMPCPPSTEEEMEISKADIKNWIKCHFERIGKMIVLENGGTCTCPNGQFFWIRDGQTSEVNHFYFNEEGRMMDDGKYFLDANCNVWAEGYIPILQKKVRELVGKIDKSSGALILSEGKFRDFGEEKVSIIIKIESGDVFTLENGRFINLQTKKLLGCITSPLQDTCDLDTVRLIHLDGSSVTVEEYDHIHRFIRLWRKMGWTIDEIDKALMGLNTSKEDCLKAELPSKDDCKDCDDLFDQADNCKDCGEADCVCEGSAEAMSAHCDITPAFLHQLVAVKKLLDKTGLELTKLLTFWTSISTAGEKSLYKRLFLTHNLLGVDEVLKADTNGNYLTKDAKISDHQPVLMAAFNLSTDDIDAIVKDAKLEDKLTLKNLSLIYRYRLFSKALGLKIPAFIDVLPLFGNPFKDADTTLEFMERWGKMEDAGFTYRQLNYIIKDHDDPKKPLSPTEKTILQLAKTLYDGLNAIDEAHKDLTPNPKATDAEAQKLDIQAQATIEFVRGKAALLFDPSVVEQMTGILEGTTVFITNAPKTLTAVQDKLNPQKDKKDVPPSPDVVTLRKKIKYDATKGAIQVMGILTPTETTELRTWSNDPKWNGEKEMIYRIENQQKKLFKAVLYTVFEVEKAKSADRKAVVEKQEEIIKAGDISIEGQPDINTADKKRVAFLTVFLPYLRQELTHRFVVDTLSNLVGLQRDTTDALISEILMLTPSTPIYSIFEKIKNSAKPVATDWHGYLIPSGEGDYTFIIKDSDITPSLTIDGVALPFKAEEDPTNEWWATHSIKLQAGKLYKISAGIDLKNVYWKTATSSIAVLPPSVLLPDFASTQCTPAFVLLKKATLLVVGFNLSTDEIRYFNDHQADFGKLNFNAIGLDQWLRLESYTRLRNSLPETKTNILAFFNWTTTVQDPIKKAKLSSKIVELTLWKKERVDKLIKFDHFNLDDVVHFRNEETLLKLQHALSVANKIGMDIDLLFDWAKPTSNFNKCRSIADSIEKAIRAQYKQTDWEQVVKPLSDKLRNNQKDALIAYLLQQPKLLEWGVTDADGLFEYFLIDVQMDACMETSRIKQAISSVQLFVMRCQLGLEEEHNGIKSDILDRERWKWMERYRVWEANRKVFLYPENWIESNLRDDKSPFFKELESELLQKDINKQNVTDALKAYLYKVDEVANMEVIGLYIDGTRPNGKWTEGAKLHIFARTRNAPYFFYYRYLALDEMNWYAWEKMQVDIPSYDIENTNGVITGNGCYLTPVVWNGRLLIFFPQFMKKPKPVSTTVTVPSPGKTTTLQSSSEYWEIKMGWSEYRNGKWTQKQLSSTTADTSVRSPLQAIENFKFIPRINDLSNLVIDIEDETDKDLNVFKFEFNGSILKRSGNESFPALTGISLPKFFNKTAENNRLLEPLKIKNDKWEKMPVSHKDNIYDSTISILTPTPTNFFHPYTRDLLGKINTGQLEAFFKFNTEGITTDAVKGDAYGLFDPDNNPQTKNYHELKRPYSLYNWELFFHTPMMLAAALSEAQQFEEAMKWYHFVFSPLAKGTENNRFWQFSPLKDTTSQRILDSIFNHLQPNTADTAINNWRNHPFLPHSVARDRPVAYMKWVVMKYVDNLVAWGDYLFRQDTIETINQATQLYILAGHILGPRPMFIPKRGKIKPQTYLSLLDKWDAFGNAMVELELIAPYSNQITTPVGNANGVVGFANVFGFSTALYFCIPNNPKLMGYWDTVADRLFKIRHCLNIEGIFRKLPLFEPPIDPALLVKATAQGLSIASVLNDLNTPMPNYRFYYLLQKALELCGELKSLGGAMLSAIEKKDNEAIALIRAKHESTMHNLVMEVKKLQLEEAQKSLETLQQNRIAPDARMRYYLKLIGLDESAVPSENANFSGLPNEIVTVVGDSGLKLIPFEKEDMDKASEAHDWQKWSGIIEALAGIFYAIPMIEVAGKPLGVGAGVALGGINLGQLTQAATKGMQIHSSTLSFESSNASKKGGFTRALQDRIQQASAAGYEIKQIDAQITAQQIRIQMANLEIKNQQKQIDNANEVEEFLKNKYTNEELYTWMRGSLKTLYHQVYSLAYDLAKKAEKTFRFERGLSSSNFIQSGYWEEGYSGLLAGERLYVGLKQLEAAYQNERGYDYEITKHISLRQINPMAVLQLKETGKCEFMLPEVLFDMDFAGHFKRRIKSVSLSIPCVAGPYTNINATLRLMENKFRNTAIGGKAYPEDTEETDERFSTYIIPISAIAASSAQNESGMFELNFKDERYLPFEGAGVISKWRLELPDFRQFDYDTISDVVMHVRYMSSEGGERLKKTAKESVTTFMDKNEEIGQQEGLFSIIDLQHDLPTEWHKAMQSKNADGDHVLKIENVEAFMPYFIKMKEGKLRESKSIKVTDIFFINKSDLQENEVMLKVGDNPYSFGKGGVSIGNTKTFAITEEDIKLGEWQLTIKDKPNSIEKAYMIIRFILKK